MSRTEKNILEILEANAQGIKTIYKMFQFITSKKLSTS